MSYGYAKKNVLLKVIQDQACSKCPVGLYKSNYKVYLDSDCCYLFICMC